jgi:hypothetical protein
MSVYGRSSRSFFEKTGNWESARWHRSKRRAEIRDEWWNLKLRSSTEAVSQLLNRFYERLITLVRDGEPRQPTEVAPTSGDSNP